MRAWYPHQKSCPLRGRSNFWRQKTRLIPGVVSRDGQSPPLARSAFLMVQDRAMSDAGDNVSPLMEALYRGDSTEVQALLAQEPQLDVFEAAALGGTGRLQDLLDEDAARVIEWSSDGFLPIHLAAFFGHAAAAELFAERGSDLEPVSRHLLARDADPQARRAPTARRRSTSPAKAGTRTSPGCSVRISRHGQKRGIARVCAGGGRPGRRLRRRLERAGDRQVLGPRHRPVRKERRGQDGRVPVRDEERDRGRAG